MEHWIKYTGIALTLIGILIIAYRAKTLARDRESLVSLVINNEAAINSLTKPSLATLGNTAVYAGGLDRSVRNAMSTRMLWLAEVLLGLGLAAQAADVYLVSMG